MTFAHGVCDCGLGGMNLGPSSRNAGAATEVTDQALADDGASIASLARRRLAALGDAATAR